MTGPERRHDDLRLVPSECAIFAVVFVQFQTAVDNSELQIVDSELRILDSEL